MRKLPTGDIRMRENRPHGSEGGEARAFPTPIGLFINILAHNENCCFPAKPLDLLNLPQILLSLNLQGTLLTQIVLPRLVGVVVAFFLGKQFQISAPVIGAVKSAANIALRKWTGRLWFSSEPSNALNTQSIFGSMRCFMVVVLEKCRECSMRRMCRRRRRIVRD